MSASPGRSRMIAAALAVELAGSLLAGCGRMGLSVPQSPLLKYVERKSGLIAYVAVDGNVAVMDQAGGAVRELSTDGVMQGPEDAPGPFVSYRLPLWSPDGTRIASVRVSGTGESVEELAVIVLGVARAEAVSVFSSTSQAPGLMAWSPDSTRLVFLASSPSGSSYGFYLVSASGGEPVLLDAGIPYGWAWSPRGHELVIHAGSAAGGLASDRLAFLDVEGEVLEEGLGIVAGVFDAPSWSPDGRLLLVAQWEEGKNRLLLTDRKRTGGAALAEVDGPLAFSFSPNGRRVAFVSDALYVAEVPARLEASAKNAKSPSGSAPASRKPLSGDDAVGAFFWSPDGTRIAYFVPGLVEVPQEEGAEGSAQQVIILTLKVVEVGRGSAREVATFVPTPGFLSLARSFAQLSQTLRLWSPDSQNILYAVIDNEGPGIMVAMATQSIAPRRVAGGLEATWSRR